MRKTITKIEVQKKNKARVNIYLDEEYAFSCNAELVYMQRLDKGKIVESEELEEVVKEENFILGKKEALKTIEKAYKTEKQIREKLQGKGYEKQVIERVITFLREYNFLNDTQYAELYVKEKCKNEGKQKIKVALMKKGVAAETIEEQIGKIDGEEERITALRIAEKKAMVLLRIEKDPQKIYKKLGDFLVRKGYRFEIVKSVVKEVLKRDIEEEFI